MDKERLEMWKAQQPKEKEPEGIVDLFKGPDKEELEKRLDEFTLQRTKPKSDSGKKSLVSVLAELRQIAGHTKMKSIGVLLNPNNVAVALKAPNSLELDTFIDEVGFAFTGKLSNIPIQHFAHIISDGIAAVYDKTNKAAIKALQSYPGADVVIGFAYWNKLSGDEQREFMEVIEKLFVEKI